MTKPISYGINQISGFFCPTNFKFLHLRKGCIKFVKHWLTIANIGARMKIVWKKKKTLKSVLRSRIGVNFMALNDQR